MQKQGFQKICPSKEEASELSVLVIREQNGMAEGFNGTGTDSVPGICERNGIAEDFKRAEVEVAKCFLIDSKVTKAIFGIES